MEGRYPLRKQDVSVQTVVGLLSLVVCLCGRVPGQVPHAREGKSGTVVRVGDGPIITQKHVGEGGDNINGPSLIRVPSWIPNPLGRYYLYFAHHHGSHIRLAYADSLEGPWNVYEPGTLQLEQTICRNHIASPDVHIDEKHRVIRMYFHGPVAGISGQVSLVATSQDGLHFDPSSEILGDSYFRVFQWDSWYYAMARAGAMFRSRSGVSMFEAGENPFDEDSVRSTVRHVAVERHGSTLTVYYSRIGDAPERIMVSTIDLRGDWKTWKASALQTLLAPDTEYEGANLPIEPSLSGDVTQPVHQLRDPAIFTEKGRKYLLYAVAGENGIALAELVAEP